MRRATLIALTALALLLVGCGTSGGSDSAETDSGGATTTADDGSSSEPKAVTSKQLEKILPVAADIGEGYEVSDTTRPGASTTTTPGGSTTAPDPMEAEMKKQCPKAAELDFLDDTDTTNDEVGVEFKNAKDQGIEVSLDPTAGPINEENIDQVIEAFNDCGTLNVTDPDMGEMEMKLSAKPLEVGDFGADITLNAKLDLFGVPVTLDFHGYIFSVDGVTVSVTAISGLDSTSMEPTPLDDERLPDLAAEMEDRVKSLTD